jgi:hypothetical protein
MEREGLEKTESYEHEEQDSRDGEAKWKSQNSYLQLEVQEWYLALRNTFN